MNAPDPSLVLVAGLPAGVFLWSFMEYVLHRFAFHEAKGRNYGSREHLRHHGSDDTVLESWYLSWAGVLLVGLAAIPFLGHLAGVTQLGWGVGIGYVAGYGFYDWVHWRAHRRPIPGGSFGRYERWLRKHHFTHHFHAPLMNHGVSSPLWDHVFGTLVTVDQVQVPRRMTMRWLTDDDGRVLGDYAADYAIRGTRHLDDTQRNEDLERAYANEVPVA